MCIRERKYCHAVITINRMDVWYLSRGSFVMETSGEDENETLDFWRDWDLSNLTEIEYLNKVLGPRYLPLRLVIPLTIAYLLIFVAGVFGNVVTCTVIVRNASMQTATNYYLFSLAISDLTLLMLGKRINGDRAYLGFLPLL